MPRLLLPKSSPGNRERLERALIRHYRAGLSEVRHKTINWTRVHWYLQGLRNFKGLWSSNQAAFEDSRGDRKVHWEQALVMIQTEMGRILSMDIRPAVIRPEGITLDGLRRTAMAQAVLDFLTARWDMQGILLELAYHLVAYGTAGLAVVGPGAPGLSDRVRLEVVPPWELLPLPAQVSSPGQAAGLCRRRKVTYDWLRQVMKPYRVRLPRPEELNGTLAPPGANLTLAGDPRRGLQEGATEAEVGPYPTRTVPEQRTPTDDEWYIRLKEYWLYGDEIGSVRRWIVQAGDRVILDIDFEDPASPDTGLNLTGLLRSLPMAPVHVARYLPLGSFYGRGFAERLVFFNAELEDVIGNILSNLADIDWLGLLLVPTEMGINLRDFEQIRKRRFGTYDFSLDANSGIQQVAPLTSGDMGARFLGLAGQLLQGLGAQGELFSGQVPGRLDSARALGVFLEAQNVPLAPVSESVAAAFAGVYRTLLAIAPSVVPDNFSLTMLRMDESLLGVRVDPNTGEVSVDPNMIPDPSDVNITIRNKAPESQIQKIEVLNQRLQLGILSPLDYKILLVREGLDGNLLLDRQEWESYRKAWWENIVLFGDGQTPGRVEGSEAGDIHPIHKKIHKALMASIAFQKASDEVRSAILDHLNQHESISGLPDTALALDNLAGLNEQPLPPGLAAQLGVPQGPQ
ncbi:MAG: hypothetical protein D6681_20280 [Calditrichaeota bacterium]|nr:MAG: hypothetical protein D6681_20280 [Calditrichota bacterium]